MEEKKNKEEKNVQKKEQDEVSKVEAIDSLDSKKEEGSSKKSTGDKKKASKKNKRKHSTLCVVLSSIITSIVVLIIVVTSFYYYAGGAMKGKATFTEAELDAPFAFYYDHCPHQVTPREILIFFHELESAKRDDGSYNVPDAQAITEYVQDRVCLEKAEREGMSVNDADMDVAAIYYAHSKDYSTIATNQDISEDQAKQDMKDRALFLKFECAEVCNILNDDTSAPEVPSDDAMNTPTAAYADYIKNLVGDAWNSETNTWNEDDKTYSIYFDIDEFNGSEATYGQAELAYFLYCTDVVLQQNETVNQQVSDTMEALLSDTLLVLPNA